MSKQVFEVESAKVLLDVIFGVIIGLPLSNFPELLNEFGLTPSLPALTKILLLSSALTFCAFYWLEVRHFIEEQKNFNEAVSKLSGKRLEGIEYSVGRLLWSLITIVLAAAILKFAEKNIFRSFLTANALFWLLDFLSNVWGNVIYKAQKDKFDIVRRSKPYEHSSYIRRFGTSFFYLDGVVSVLLFVALLLLDYVLDGPVKYRACASIAIIILTLTRHLIWRTKVYEWWKQRRPTV